MSTFKVVDANSLPPFELDRFLGTVYKPEKSEFLRLHGAWWHRGNQNRLAVIDGDRIAAYCGVIPIKCFVRGEPYEALWWVDLIVASEFRGRGIQSILDGEVRRTADLKLGFPNELAAKIHLKHGWGVRDDCRVLLLPLLPRQLRGVRRATGVKGAFLRQGAQALSPVAGLAAWYLADYEPDTARLDTSPNPHKLARAFLRNADRGVLTCYRDAEFLNWRYFDSPHFDQYAFYTAGDIDDPSHVLITRRIPGERGNRVRVLDVFGDLGDRRGLRDILKLAVRDAVRQGGSQVTILSSAQPILSAARSTGFLIGNKVRFCWHSDSNELLQDLSQHKCQWSLGDSDNDEPS